MGSRPSDRRAARSRLCRRAAARAGGVFTAGTRAALWSGIVGGLLVFTVSMTATYARDGRPYDPQLLRDLPHSGAPDLATLAVSDALASALTLLILIPLTALASGSIGARLPRTTDPDGTTSAAPRRTSGLSPLGARDRSTLATARAPSREQGRIPEASDISPATTSSCSRREPSRSGPRTSSPPARSRTPYYRLGRRRAVRWPRRRRCSVAWKRAARPKMLRSSRRARFVAARRTVAFPRE